MKLKFLLVILMLVLNSGVCVSQVPNSGFENWTLVSGQHETPDYWVSNSSGVSESVFKTGDKYTGNFAMKH